MAQLKTFAERLKTNDFPNPAPFTSPEQCQAAYESGMPFVSPDPEGEEVLADYVKQQGGNYSGEEVAYGNNFAGSADGKDVVLLYQEAYKASGVDDWIQGNPAQQVGDCFVAGTMVTMSDGTIKPIEEVKAGEKVLTPQGNTKSVITSFSKDYEGELHTVRSCGGNEIKCTSDHRFLTPENDFENSWTPATLFTDNTRLLRPYAEPLEKDHVFDLAEYGSLTAEQTAGRSIKPIDGRVRAYKAREDCPRFIKLDEDFAWFLGLFMAEGSLDKRPNGMAYRIRFNLNYTETHLSDRVLKLCKRFGVTARQRTVPSKPTVHYAEISNCSLAELVYRLIKMGNTYTKQVPDQVFSASKEVRRSFLHGWMAGDGHFRMDQRKDCNALALKATGVSVNFDMLNGMSRIARSLGIIANTYIRSPRKQSKQAYDLYASGNDAIDLAGEKAVDAVAVANPRPQEHRKTKLGISSRIKYNNTEHWQGKVYCIEVKDDHAFIANGYAVHNCVSHSTRNALILSLACQVANKNGGWPTDIPPESYKKMTAFTSVPLYLTRSNAPGHGWSCPTSVTNATKYMGMVVAKDFSGVAGVGVDYSKYSGSQTTKFGRGFPPTDYITPLSDHKVTSSCKVSGLDNLLDMLASGFSCSTCGGESWATGSSARNSDGYAKRTNKGWNHALAIYGFVRTKEWMAKYSEVGIIIGNSWGSSSCGGNRKIMGRDDLPQLPKNCWIAKWSECKNRHYTAVSAVAGWPPAKLKDWSAIRGLI